MGGGWDEGTQKIHTLGERFYNINKKFEEGQQIIA